MEFAYLAATILIFMIMAVLVLLAVRFYKRFKSNGDKTDRAKFVYSLLTVFILAVINALLFIIYHIFSLMPRT
jgi:heme/copper-type cytochrome/quinol oxidase subunit 2